MINRNLIGVMKMSISPHEMTEVIFLHSSVNLLKFLESYT